MLSKEFHSSRRALYHEFLENGHMALMFAGNEKKMAGDEYYPFSVYRNFYYITGCESQAAVYLAYRYGGVIREMLFLQRPDEIEAFMGRRK